MAFDAGAAVAHIKADITNFKQGMQEAKQEANGLGQTISNVGSGIATFGKSAAILAGVVGGGLALAAKTGLDSAAKFEQYQIAFTTLLKDQKKAAEAIKNIQEDAAKTPFELAPLVAANQRLISAGVNAGQARKDIINLGNAISATGGSGVELERLSTNLQQIKAVGKASALDIKQFAFAGINVYQLLADSMGKNVEQIKEMDISYDDLTKAFEKAGQKGGMFEDAMLKQSRSLNGLMSTLKDTVSLGLKDILMDSGIFDLIRNGVAALIPFLEGTAVPAIKRFFAVLGNGFALLGDIMSGQNVMAEVREFLSYFMGGEMPGEDHPAVKFMYAFANALQFVGNWIMEHQELVLTFVKGLAIAVGALLVIGTVTALIMAFTNPLVLVALAIAALYTAWQTNFLGIRDITTAVFGAVMAFINDIFMPLIQVFVDWFTERWVFIQMMIQGVWQIIVGIIQVAWAIVYGLLAAGIALLQGDWKKAWDVIKSSLSTAWEGIKNIFNGAINFIKGWAGTMFNELVKPFEDAWNRIQETVRKIKDALDFTKRHSPSVLDVVQRGVRLVNNALDDLVPGVPNITPNIAGVGISNAGPNVNQISVTIPMDGAIIADDLSAQRMMEKIGDGIIKKLQMQIRF